MLISWSRLLAGLQSFFAWAAFHAHMGDLKEADVAMLEEMIGEVERRHGVRLPPGHNPKVEHVAFTREDLTYNHRLLAFYVCIKAAQMIGGESAVPACLPAPACPCLPARG